MLTPTGRPSPRSRRRARPAHTRPRHSLRPPTAPYDNRRQPEGTCDVFGQTPGPPSACPPRPNAPQSADDVMMAIALTATWALVTGRRPRAGRPLFHDLPVPELSDFWADDHLPPRPESLSGHPE